VVYSGGYKLLNRLRPAEERSLWVFFYLHKTEVKACKDSLIGIFVGFFRSYD